MKNKNAILGAITFLIAVVIVLLSFNIAQAKVIEETKFNLREAEASLSEVVLERNDLKDKNEELVDKNSELNKTILELEEKQKKEEQKEEEITELETETVSEPTKEEEKTTYTAKPLVHENVEVEAKTEIDDREFLAKLLYCEAGGEGWECQVYTCSAILNLSDYTGRSIWEMGHDYNTFSVAYIVDDAKPTQTQYDVIDYVLNGGRIAEICYFRTGHYHNFGTPVCQVGVHYFSKP